MKDKNYKQLADEILALLNAAYTTTDAVVTFNEDGIYIRSKLGNYYSDTFHYMNEVIDFVRCKRLSQYVTAEIENGKPTIIVCIF